MINRPGASLDSSSSSALGLKSMQKRYIQLCEDFTALGRHCSKTGGRKSFKQMNTIFISCCLWFPLPPHPPPSSRSFSLTVKQCRECPDGWLHIGNQCYYFSNDKLDWMKSRDSCEEMGSHLTILHTIEQHVCKLMTVCMCGCVCESAEPCWPAQVLLIPLIVWVTACCWQMGGFG